MKWLLDSQRFMTHRLRTTGLDMLGWFIGEERVEVTSRVQARREYQGRGRFRGMCKFQVDQGFIQDGCEQSKSFVEKLSIQSYQQAIVEVADHQLTVAPVCSLYRSWFGWFVLLPSSLT